MHVRCSSTDHCCALNSLEPSKSCVCWFWSLLTRSSAFIVVYDAHIHCPYDCNEFFFSCSIFQIIYIFSCESITVIYLFHWIRSLDHTLPITWFIGNWLKYRCKFKNKIRASSKNSHSLYTTKTTSTSEETYFRSFAPSMQPTEILELNSFDFFNQKNAFIVFIESDATIEISWNAGFGCNFMQITVDSIDLTAGFCTESRTTVDMCAFLMHFFWHCR